MIIEGNCCFCQRIVSARSEGEPVRVECLNCGEYSFLVEGITLTHTDTTTAESAIKLALDAFSLNAVPDEPTATPDEPNVATDESDSE